MNGTHRQFNTSAPPAELLDAPLPSDPEAERAVLASIILDPTRMADVSAALSVDDLAVPVHRSIYGAMLRLHAAGTPIDATLLVGALADAGGFDRLGDADPRRVVEADLLDLLNLLPTAAHCMYYVARVLEVARRRRAMLQALDTIASVQRAGDDVRPASAIDRATRHAVEHRLRQARRGVRR